MIIKITDTEALEAINMAELIASLDDMETIETIMAADAAFYAELNA